jgi:hypothetical protein
VNARISAPQHPSAAREGRMRTLRQRSAQRTAAEQRELLDLLVDALASHAPPGRPS